MGYICFDLILESIDWYYMEDYVKFDNRKNFTEYNRRIYFVYNLLQNGWYVYFIY